MSGINQAADVWTGKDGSSRVQTLPFCKALCLKSLATAF